MVQAVIRLNEHEDRIINIVKGKQGFKNKSEAVNYIIDRYEQNILEPQLKPEYVEELRNIKKESHTAFSSIADLRKMTER